MNTIRIGWVSVRDDDYFLSRVGSANGLTHGDDRGLSVARASNVVGSDFKAP